MDTKEKWEALSKSAQSELLDSNRYCSTDWGSEWYSGIYEDFERGMADIGVVVTNIYFSGFSSQGDGACFEGYVKEWGKFLTATGDKELAAVSDLFNLSLSWAHHGYYYHERCTSFSADLTVENPHDPDSDPLRYEVWEITQPEGGPFEGLEESFIDFLRGHMKDLYHLLEKEYDYLTDDEQVMDYILNHCEDEIDEAYAAENEDEGEDESEGEGEVQAEIVTP